MNTTAAETVIVAIETAAQSDFLFGGLLKFGTTPRGGASAGPLKNCSLWEGVRAAKKASIVQALTQKACALNYCGAIANPYKLTSPVVTPLALA